MYSVGLALRALDDGRHRAEFYRMWHAGHSAGFAHPKTFEQMGPRLSPQTEEVRAWLLAGTKRGKGIAELVKIGGDRFEEFERALLTAGEESGGFDAALKLLGEFYARKQQVMNAVKKQMAYPLFTGLFASFIAPLKLLVLGRTTEYLVAAIGMAILLTLSAGSIVAAVARRYGRKPPLARARMARALATAIEAGLPLPRALRLAADASANPAIAAHVASQGEKLLASRSIAESLRGCPYLTPDFITTLQVSEGTGDFRPLTRLAEMYEDGFR